MSCLFNIPITNCISVDPKAVEKTLDKGTLVNIATKKVRHDNEGDCYDQNSTPRQPQPEAAFIANLLTR